MSPFVQLITCIILAILALILSRIIMGWLQSKACTKVVKDLERKNAFDENSSVFLPYAQPKLLRFGFRDYRPTALKILIEHKIVVKKDDNTYYLKPGYPPFVFKDMLLPWNRG